ncbi:Hypothetical predicted protein [Paramuricea clavata]|uniref:Uncharacterized protein n=1 Tax=Paramuricea clavata TaxID=317549 RepID=A0A6S7JMI3_PARCT|nr:Hypothetical predicted protein [Paramuricea clavata]
MGKKEGKYVFFVTQNTKVCNVHFSPEDVLKVPGGKRWRLKDGAIPLKAGQAPVVLNMKRKPPTMRNEAQITTKKPKVSSTSDVGSIRYQPKSLLSSALAVVDKVYKAMVHENKETK